MRHRNAMTGEIVQPIDFTTDGGSITVEAVGDTQNPAFSTASNFIQETFKPIQEMDLVLLDAVAAHGLLQNSISVAFANFRFHGIILTPILDQKKTLICAAW